MDAKAIMGKAIAAKAQQLKALDELHQLMLDSTQCPSEWLRLINQANPHYPPICQGNEAA